MFTCLLRARLYKYMCVWVRLCVYCFVNVIYANMSYCVLKQCLKLLVSIILGVLLNVGGAKDYVAKGRREDAASLRNLSEREGWAGLETAPGA